MLGKGDPNIPQDFFRFVVEEIRTLPLSRPGGHRFFMVRNKRDFNRYDWLIGATVELDGLEHIVQHVELEPSFKHNFDRVGELIGLLAKRKI